uniref:Myeloid associated differentiation marker n=1 Tax=Salarias fasciatus TaxID=181472 RepID=A0A672HLE9_SALFA
MVFTCMAFSVAAHGAELSHRGMADWCIFCWAFSFACTLLVLLVEQFGLQTRAPVSWSNFPITVACYAALLCLSASIIFPLFFLKDQYLRNEVRDHRIASTVFSCLAAVAYMGEVSLSKARPGEVAGYMATWCMAVYCICFILSMGVVVLCVGELTGCLPIPFSKFLSAYGLLAVVMYLTATIIWPVFQFDKSCGSRGRNSPRVIAAAVLTAFNFLLYLADLAYTARLVFATV